LGFTPSEIIPRYEEITIMRAPKDLSPVGFVHNPHMWLKSKEKEQVQGNFVNTRPGEHRRRVSNIVKARDYKFGNLIFPRGEKLAETINTRADLL